jgi:hypothetical protein
MLCELSMPQGTITVSSGSIDSNDPLYRAGIETDDTPRSGTDIFWTLLGSRARFKGHSLVSLLENLTTNSQLDI